MQKNDEPVFPQAFIERYDASSAHPDREVPVWGRAAGLTKRELFALGAMVGLLSSLRSPVEYSDIANFARQYAEALIAELSKEGA